MIIYEDQPKLSPKEKSKASQNEQASSKVTQYKRKQNNQLHLYILTQNNEENNVLMLLR